MSRSEPLRSRRVKRLLRPTTLPCFLIGSDHPRCFSSHPITTHTCGHLLYLFVADVRGHPFAFFHPPSHSPDACRALLQVLTLLLIPHHRYVVHSYQPTNLQYPPLILLFSFPLSSFPWHFSPRKKITESSAATQPNASSPALQRPYLRPHRLRFLLPPYAPGRPLVRRPSMTLTRPTSAPGGETLSLLPPN